MQINPVFDAYKSIGDLIEDASLMPVWSPDGKTLAFLSGPPEERTGWRVDLATGRREALFDIAKLREACKAATGVTPPGQGVPFAHFGFTGPNSISFAVGTDQVILDLNSYQATRVPPPSALDVYMGTTDAARRTPRTFKHQVPLVDPIDATEVTSPDGEWLLSIQNHNVCIRSVRDGRFHELTADGTADVRWHIDWQNPMLALLGMAVPVTTWSPDSEKIAVYRVDERGVAELPQPHYLQRAPEVVMRVSARAGGTLERTTLHVLDVAGAAPVDIQLGDTRDTYPVFAGWLPDASGLVIFLMSRDCRCVDVLVADARSGATRKVFREEGKTFIRIHHDIYYGRKLGLNITPDGKGLLWLSERDGYKHIYRYDLDDGRLLGQLTRGDWPVDEVKQVAGGYVYFTAHCDTQRPYDLHLCRVPLQGGEVQQLTEAPGKHSAIFAPNGKVFLDTHSSPDRPPVTELRTVEGKCLNPAMLRANIAKLEAVGFTAPEEFKVKAADGVTDLWGVMYKPHDFDPGRKYPLVEYIYGGPQIAVADHAFPSSMGVMGAEALRIAQLGCIVVMLDARGTPERSKAFHDVVYKNWAEALVADHAGAIRQLAERHSFIDGKRVGVTGFSWGGYSSTRLLLEAPEVYKCASSGAPGYNPWAMVLYECYLGFPQSDADVYRRADVVRLAPKLQGALQIVCGTSDHACWPDAMKMAEALIRSGKDFDFIAMPGQGHGFDTPHDAFYQRKRAEFFNRHLGSAQERAP